MSHTGTECGRSGNETLRSGRGTRRPGMQSNGLPQIPQHHTTILLHVHTHNHPPTCTYTQPSSYMYIHTTILLHVHTHNHPPTCTYTLPSSYRHTITSISTRDIRYSCDWLTFPEKTSVVLWWLKHPHTGLDSHTSRLGERRERKRLFFQVAHD